MEGLSGITIQRVTEASDLDTLHAQDPFLCLKCGARVFPASNVGTWGCSTHPRLFVRGLERYACCNREYGSGGCVPCDHVRMHGDLQMLFVINKEFLCLKNGFKIEEPLSQARQGLKGHPGIIMVHRSPSTLSKFAAPDMNKLLEKNRPVMR